MPGQCVGQCKFFVNFEGFFFFFFFKKKVYLVIYLIQLIIKLDVKEINFVKQELCSF